MPSYYGELYNTFEKEYRNDFNKFSKSKHALIYDYYYLRFSLKKFDNVSYIKFNKLVNNHYTINDLIPNISKSNENIIISKKNVKKRIYSEQFVEIKIQIDRFKHTLFFKSNFYKYYFAFIKSIKLGFVNSFIRRKLIINKIIRIKFQMK